MSSKLVTLIVVSGLLVGLGVAPLGAQTNLLVKANIPFEFMVGSKTLPAGEYTVNPNTVYLATFLWYSVLDRRTAEWPVPLRPCPLEVALPTTSASA